MQEVPSEVITCACSAVKVVADDFTHLILTKLYSPLVSLSTKSCSMGILVIIYN